MDYHILAERLVDLQTSFHPVPISQELAVLDRGMFLALNYLMLHNYSAYPKELSRGMGVNSARVAALLNHLEKEGLISRRADPGDNRQVIVSLTEEGAEIIGKKRERLLDMVAQILEELGPEDAETLLRIEQKLVNRFLLQAQNGVSSGTDDRKEADSSSE